MTYAETYDYHYQGVYTPSHPQPHQHSTANTAERHVLAERYKTKVCRNYLSTGECPYEVRCMFAHGDHEMRTCEMNVRDGLITEEAIKAFQRAFNLRHQSQQSLIPAQTQPVIPEYIGLPPLKVGESRFVHNPYGYAVVRSNSSDDLVGAVKVDPSEAMEP